MAERHTNDFPQHYLIKDSKAQELISKLAISEAPMFSETVQETPFNFERYMRAGIGAYFDAVITFLPGQRALVSNPSDLWYSIVDVGYTDEGVLRCPLSYGGYYNIYRVGFYSKAFFRYPRMGVYTKMPVFTGVDYQTFSFGFKLGRRAGTGLAGISLWRSAGDTSDYLSAEYGGRFNWHILIDITGALPSDYTTNRHAYHVKVNKMNVEFYVDYKLVAVAINSPNLGFVVSYPPYAIDFDYFDIAPMSMAYVELENDLASEAQAPLSPSYVKIQSDDPSPPRVYKLYWANSNDYLQGSNVTSGSATCHPVPVLGYANKTFLFRATRAGTIDVEVLGHATWLTYDSVRIQAEKLFCYKIPSDVVLARITYTPSSYPANIGEATAILY